MPCYHFNYVTWWSTIHRLVLITRDQRLVLEGCTVLSMLETDLGLYCRAVVCAYNSHRPDLIWSQSPGKSWVYTNTSHLQRQSEALKCSQTSKNFTLVHWRRFIPQFKRKVSTFFIVAESKHKCRYRSLMNWSKEGILARSTSGSSCKASQSLFKIAEHFSTAGSPFE